MNLKGKTALVTGASSGIGAAIARQLAAIGSDLVITARRKENLDALAKELTERHGVTVDVLPADLSEPDAAKALFDATEGAGKPIDILVNNAGYGIQSHLADSDLDHLLRMF